MIVFISTSDEERQKANEVYQQILAAAMSLGGTVSGEHGIGRMKKSQLSDEIGPIGMAVHRAIKTALDEHGIFNPGSMFSLDPGPTYAAVAAESGFYLDTRHARRQS